jgi:pyridoxine 5-phosphate synthase
MILLGVNIDHIATLRNARGGSYPCPLHAAHVAEHHGADGITVHLREDRRHIRDHDVWELRRQVTTRLNLEMANTPDMVALAALVRPDMVTLVPEKRQELTTEGGLGVISHTQALAESVTKLQGVGIAVSLFVDPDEAQLRACQATGAQFIELHTGRYCEATERATHVAQELEALHNAARLAVELGLRVNAGHGLHYGNVRPILSLAGLEELNIGHSLISEAVFTGLGSAVARMKQVLQSESLPVASPTLLTLPAHPEAMPLLQ